MIWVVLELAMFSTLMVTWRLETDWVGVPEMTPVAEFSERPDGSDPEFIEKVGISASVEGLTENAVPRAIV